METGDVDVVQVLHHSVAVGIDGQSSSQWWNRLGSVLASGHLKIPTAYRAAVVCSRMNSDTT